MTMIYKLNKIYQNINNLFCLFVNKTFYIFIVKILNKNNFFENIRSELIINLIFDKIAT